MSDSKQIERITGYENMMQEAYDIMKGNDFYREKQDRLAYLMSELRSYYESSEWRKDFEDDEKGLLPNDLHRGVLSEDGLYDLLDEYGEYLEDAKVKTFEFHSMFDQDHFSLHDCLVTSIELDGNEERYFVVPHDIEDFRMIIERYGADWNE